MCNFFSTFFWYEIKKTAQIMGSSNLGYMIIMKKVCDRLIAFGSEIKKRKNLFHLDYDRTLYIHDREFHANDRIFWAKIVKNKLDHET